MFAALRATAVITQRTFVNYPTLWCCVIFDIAVFVIVIFARRITTAWHDHRALLDAANLIAALAIAAIAGIDLSTPDALEHTIAYISGIIDEIAALTEEIDGITLD